MQKNNEALLNKILDSKDKPELSERDTFLDDAEKEVSARVKNLKQRPGARGKTRGAVTIDGKINYDLIHEMGKLDCTHQELAALTGYTRQNIDLLVEEDESFKNAFESGKSIGKLSLRRLQRRRAEDGHVSMLIFLGKQSLGQRDKQEVITHDFDPRKLPTEELDRMVGDRSSES